MNKKRNVLLSMNHDDVIITFAKQLLENNFNIVAPRKTAEYLMSLNVQAMDISSFTGYITDELSAELFNPQVYKSLISEDIPEGKIDVVCVDLNSLNDEISKVDATTESVFQSIDFNHSILSLAAIYGSRFVLVDDYSRVEFIKWIKAGELKPLKFIREMNARAEFAVSHYRSVSSEYYGRGDYQSFFGERYYDVSIGVNRSFLYKNHSYKNDQLSFDKFKIISGELKLDDIMDFDLAVRTMTFIAAGMELNFDKVPFIALGVRDEHVYSAGFSSSLNFEAVSRFALGGVYPEVPSGLFICNFPIDKLMAESLVVDSSGKRNNITTIICPAINKNAVPVIQGKNENFTILIKPELSLLGLKDIDTSIGFKHIRGGFVSHTNYPRILNFKEVKRYGRDKNILHIETNKEYYNDLVLAWAITEASIRKSLAVVKNARLIANACADAGHTTLAKLTIMIAEDSMSSLIGSCVSCNSTFDSREAVEMLLINGATNLVTYDCPGIVYLFTDDKPTQLFQI